MGLDCVSQQWQSSIRVLGAERVRQLSVHKGRHTCASHLLSAGIPGTVVRDTLGHSNMSITDIYLHALPVDHITSVFGSKTVLTK
jgi:site-specific recombinase XerD